MKVQILVENQKRFKSMIEIDADNWVTAPSENGGYFIGCKNGTHEIIKCDEELIDIGDRFGEYIVDDLNFKPINEVVYLELELV